MSKKTQLPLDCNEPYKASNPIPIPKNAQSIDRLIQYLNHEHGTGSKPEDHKKDIKEIFDKRPIENLLNKDKSEYLKILGLCAILSSKKHTWYELLVTHHKNSKLFTLETNPLAPGRGNKNLINDEIISIFYDQLYQGIPEIYNNDKIESILRNDPSSNLYNLLSSIKISIEALIDFYVPIFLTTKRHRKSIASAVIKIRNLLKSFLIGLNKDPFEDGLRLSLIKFASLNTGVNELRALRVLHESVKHEFPMKYYYKFFDEIDRVGTDFNDIEAMIKYIYFNPDVAVPKDLFDCARMVCDLYCYDKPSETKQEYNVKILSMSAMLLFDDFIAEAAVNTRIRGENNKYTLLYNSLSKFVKANNNKSIVAPDNKLNLQQTSFVYFILRHHYGMLMYDMGSPHYILDWQLRLNEIKCTVIINFLSDLKNYGITTLPIINEKLLSAVEESKKQLI